MVKYFLFWCSVAAASLTVSSRPAYAQFYATDDGVRIEVYTVDGQRLDNVQLEVTALSGSSTSSVMLDRANPGQSGMLSRTGTSKAYKVRVLSPSGQMIYETMVQSDPMGVPARIHLPRSVTEKNLPSGRAVSYHELTHKVPAKARKYFEKAAAAHRKKDAATELENLEKAVAEDPEFLAAQDALGTRYLKAERWADAERTMLQVVKYDNNSEHAYANLSVAYFYQKKYGEAEAAARRALTLNGSRRNNYLTGVALAAAGKKQEALTYLDAAGDEFPRSTLIALQILAETGDVAGARSRASKYLNTGDQVFRKEVEDWMKRTESVEAADLKKKTTSEASGAAH